MKHTLTSKAAELMRKNGRHRRWRRAFSGMAAVVVFITTYMLILPAITMENQAICGMAEHTHTDACYEMQLVCNQEETPEGADVHVHGPECYEQQQVLTCTKQEGEGHTHTDACYGYVCGQEESAGHTHTDACYTEVTHRELTCTEPESAGHSHGEGCYDADGNLVCTEAESTGHTHGDSCYTETVTRELTCGQEESSGHTHTDACIGLICGKEEYEGHTHTDACYTTEDVLVCTEPTGHTHGDSCYEKVLVCDVPEHTHTEECYPAAEPEEPQEPQEPELICTIPEHSHEDACYDADGNLICGMEEHTHTEECYAPVEIPEEETPTTAFPDEKPEGYVEYTFENEEEGLSILVYAPENAFGDQKVDLFAEVLPEGSEGYIEAQENLEKAENAPEYTGMAAMDIRFVDAAAEDPAQAEEIEPDAEMGQVFVKIDAKALLPEDVDESTLAVQHHAKVSDGGIFGTGILEHTDVVVETVADISEETGDITAVPDETVLPETLPALADEPEMAEAATLEEPAAETEETQPATMNVEAEFAVNSFSTFTITWGEKKDGHVLLVHYITDKGDPLTGTKTTEFRLENNSEVPLQDYADEFIGSNWYQKAIIYGTDSQELTVTTVRYSEDYGWQYKAADSNAWITWMLNGEEPQVYLVYGTTNMSPIETVDSVSKKINISLFDYDSFNTWEWYDTNYGINEGKTLKFNNLYPDGSSANGYSSDSPVCNVWTGNNGGVRQGIVSSKLSGGYPTLSGGNVVGYSSDSLSYLFSGGNSSVTAYTGLNHLFKMENGYYVFDSDENYAYLDTSNNNKNFTVYNQMRQLNNPSSAEKPRFMPLDFYEENVPYNYNYHFGMTIDFSFVMPKGGGVDGQDMIFEFRGDDDVWVFVDDMLVLDMGGIHNKYGGSINFATGVVSVDGKSDTTLEACVRAALGYDANAWIAANMTRASNGNLVFKDYSQHSFKFFYLERGAGASNCMIKFNMPSIPENSLLIGKDLDTDGADANLQEYLNNLDFSFRVLEANSDELFLGEGTTYTLMDSTTGQQIGEPQTVGVDGIIKVKAGQIAVLEGAIQASMENYRVQELIPESYATQYSGVFIDESTSLATPGEVTIGGVVYKTYTTNQLNPENAETSVRFKNEINWENISFLEISKTVVGVPLQTNPTYYIKVLLGDQTGNAGTVLPAGTEYQLKNSDGTTSTQTVNTYGLIALKNGETATLPILAGTEFYVVETDQFGTVIPSSGTKGYTPSYQVGTSEETQAPASGIVSVVDATETVAITNTYPTADGELTITKKFVASDGSPVDAPTSVAKVVLKVRQYYMVTDESGTDQKVIVSTQDVELSTRATDTASGKTVLTGEMTGVYYYTDFEVLSEKLYDNAGNELTGVVADFNPDDFVIDRKYAEADITGIGFNAPTSGNEFTWPGAGFILAKATNGNNWQICMRYMPSENEQETVLNYILQAIEEAKPGGSGGENIEERVTWVSIEEIKAAGTRATVQFLGNGDVYLKFPASSTWSQYYYGTYDYSNVSISASMNNTVTAGDLSITKSVEKNGVPQYGGTFTFDVKLPGSYLNTSYSLAYAVADDSNLTPTTTQTLVFNEKEIGTGTDENPQYAVATVTVQGGETVTIKGLPAGVKPVISETGYDGYAPKWGNTDDIPVEGVGSDIAANAGATVTTNPISASDPIEVTCTNTTGAVLPSTGGMGTTPFLALGTLLTLGAGMLLVQRRRKEGSDAV